MMSQLFQLGAVITLQDQMSQGLQTIKKRWDELKLSLGDADKRIVGMEKSMKTFSMGAKLLGVGLAGAYFLKEPLESAKQFDAALGELKAISGATAEEMEKLRKKAIEAGIATEFDPSQAVQGLTSLASVGMDAETAIAALDASLNLATASMGKLTVDQASALIAAVEKGFGRGHKATAEDFKYISSVFVNMANMTNYSMDEMEQSFRGILSVLPNFNQELESSAAIMMALKSNMKTAVGAGETLRIATNNLANASPKAKQALASLGVDTYDKVTKKFRPVIDIIEDLSTKLEGYSEEQRNALLQTILGVDGMAAYGAVVGAVNQKTGSTGVKAIREWTNEIKNNANATDEFAKIKLETFAGQVGLLNGVWSTFKLLIGEHIGNAIKPFLKMLNAIATPVVEFLKEHPRITKFIATFAMLGVVGLTVAGGIMVVTSAFKMFMLAVNMGLVSNPFGWIVIGVAGAIAGIALLIAYWDNIVNAFKTGWNFVRDIWDNMSGFGKTVVTLFAPFIGIPMLIYDNWESISGLLFDIVDWFDSLFSSMGESFGTLDEITSAFSNIKSMILEVWNSLPNEIKEAIFLALFNPILGLGSLIWNAISRVFTNIKSRMQEGGRGFIEAFKMGLMDSINDLKEGVSKVFSVIAKFLPHSDAEEGPLSNITKSGKAFISTFLYGVNSMRANIKPAIAETFTQVQTQMENTSLLSRAYEGLKDFGSSIVNKAGQGLEKIKDFGRKSGSALIQTFNEGIESLGSGLDSTIGKVFGKTKEQFPQSNAKRGAFSNLTGSGRALVETFAEGVQSADKLFIPSFEKMASFKNATPVNESNVFHKNTSQKQTTIQADKLIEVVIQGSKNFMSSEELAKVILQAINRELERYEVLT